MASERERAEEGERDEGGEALNSGDITLVCECRRSMGGDSDGSSACVCGCAPPHARYEWLGLGCIDAIASSLLVRRSMLLGGSVRWVDACALVSRICTIAAQNSGGGEWRSEAD